MIVVIGSGPAGVSAARALVARGLRPLVIDGGVELEPDRRARVDELGAQPASAWSPATVARVREQRRATFGGVPMKFVFGSDFPYRDVERELPTRLLGASTQASLARGGLSTVWGSCALPYMDEDLAAWPIALADLAPHYRAVTGWMPLSAEVDDLSEILPVFADTPVALQRSEQARSLMQDLERSRARLGEAGLRFGWSRLAVRAAARGASPGCAYCGMCLSGCPYRLIYDASATLRELVRDDLVDYRPGIVIERIEEAAAGVRLLGHERASGEAVEIAADRVFVGAGVIATTRLMLHSLDAYDRDVTLADSQYFLLPLLRLAGSAGIREQSLGTLAQLFLELGDPTVARHNVHLQVYGYNDLFGQLLDRPFGPLARAARLLTDRVLGRLMLIQGFLHSDDSPSIRARLVRDAAAGRAGATLELEGRPNPETRPAIRRVIRRLMRLAPALRTLPIGPALQMSTPGRGFHTGGSFPMRAQPGEFETDTLGRPTGMDRVHLIDSSVFPTVPSTTIAFTIMANAHRIASAATD